MSDLLVVQERYRLDEIIGQGGMGAVYAATDLRLGHRVAVKRLLGQADWLRDAFIDEARLLARLRHPGLARVTDHLVAGADAFLVMEYIPGDDLAALLARRSTPFDAAETLAWADQILDVLAYLHRQSPPVIHRDIKPGNLKRTPDGGIVLLDFGLARGGEVSLPGHTPAYAPPEQVRGLGTDARSDLYALGATLYELLTRRRPPDALDRLAAWSSGARDPCVPLPDCRPELPPGLGVVIEAALAVDPERRPADAMTMRVSLAALTAAANAPATIVARPAPAVPPTPPVESLALPRLAPPPAPLVGREDDMAAVLALLTDPTVRLVTLLGPGGVGKTRLVLEVAGRVAAEQAWSVALIELAALREPALVLPAIATALGLREAAGQDAAARLRVALAGRPLLLVLDNLEQILGAAGDLARLLADCPALVLLTTSRAPLRLRGEHLVAIDPLPEGPAIALFDQLGRAARPGFAVTPALHPTVAAICRQLDGLPLALELAAARLRLLPPAALLERLEHRLAVLTGGPRDLPDRQRTLRGTLAWSYELLSPAEQALFRRLAVCAGGVTMETAEIIAAAAGPLPLTILDGLAALVDHSLLTPAGEADEGEPRLGMLATIREFGLECLAAAGEVEPTQAALAEHCLALAEAAVPELVGPSAPGVVARLAREEANLRAALVWARGAAGPAARAIGARLCAALARYWEVRGLLSEGRGWLEWAIGAVHEPPPALRARLLAAAGGLAILQGEMGPATARLDEALGLYQGLDDQTGQADVFNALGTLAYHAGDYPLAGSRYEAALARRRRLGDVWGAASTLSNLGAVANHQGDYARARRLLEEALALRHTHGDRAGTAGILTNLAFAADAEGDLAGASRYIESSLALYREQGNRRGVARALRNLGYLARQQGEFVRATSLIEEALALQRDLGDERGVADSLDSLGALARLAGEFDRAEALHAEALARLERLGDRRGLAGTRHRLGLVAEARGDLAVAAREQATSLAAWQTLGDARGQADCLEALARLAITADPATAARLWGAATAARAATGSTTPTELRPANDQAVAALRAALAEPAWSAAVADGQAAGSDDLRSAAATLAERLAQG